MQELVSSNLNIILINNIVNIIKQCFKSLKV